MADELLSAGKIAEMLGVSPSKVSKVINDNAVEPDQMKGNGRYFGADKVAQIEALLKK
jgi:predicted transcriptional regulator